MMWFFKGKKDLVPSEWLIEHSIEDSYRDIFNWKRSRLKREKSTLAAKMSDHTREAIRRGDDASRMRREIDIARGKMAELSEREGNRASKDEAMGSLTTEVQRLKGELDNAEADRTRFLGRVANFERATWLVDCVREKRFRNPNDLTSPPIFGSGTRLEDLRDEMAELDSGGLRDHEVSEVEAYLGIKISEDKKDDESQSISVEESGEPQSSEEEGQQPEPLD